MLHSLSFSLKKIAVSCWFIPVGVDLESESSFLAMVCCMILMEELINLITSWFLAVYPANGLSNCNPNWQFEKEVSLPNTVMGDDHYYLRFQCPNYCCNQHNYLDVIYSVIILYLLVWSQKSVCSGITYLNFLSSCATPWIILPTFIFFLIVQTCLVPAKRAI